MATPAATANIISKIQAAIQKIPPKTRLYGFGGVILVTIVLFIYFVHIPLTAQIKQLEKDIAGLQATIAANDEKIKKLDELRAEVKALQEEFALMAKQIPTGSEVSTLLGDIQKLVSQSGLTLKLWRPDKKKTASNGLYDEVPITIELTGGYHDLALLFDRISKLTRIVNMMNLRMGSVTLTKAGSIEIKINCTAMTFAALEKKPDVAPAAKQTK